jgi:hypothetical protein
MDVVGQTIGRLKFFPFERRTHTVESTLSYVKRPFVLAADRQDRRAACLRRERTSLRSGWSGSVVWTTVDKFFGTRKIRPLGAADPHGRHPSLGAWVRRLGQNVSAAQERLPAVRCCRRIKSLGVVSLMLLSGEATSRIAMPKARAESIVISPSRPSAA